MPPPPPSPFAPRLRRAAPPGAAPLVARGFVAWGGRGRALFILLPTSLILPLPPLPLFLGGSSPPDPPIIAGACCPLHPRAVVGGKLSLRLYYAANL